MRNKEELSRRRFVGLLACGAQGIMKQPEIPASDMAWRRAADGMSTVVMASHTKAIDSNTIVPAYIQITLDAAIRAETGIQDIGAAWKSLFPGIMQTSIICIKVNCINNLLSSHPETAHCIVNGLTSMIVEGKPFPENNIIIWDRTDNELIGAKYSINTGKTGVRCFGSNNAAGGYNSIKYPIDGGGSVRVSTILSDMSNYLVNLSVLKQHGSAGTTLSMKNHYGSINNPSIIHPAYQDPCIPSLNMVAPIREKQKICICDALFGIISGGPSGSPQIAPRSILVSRDPVAIDYIGSTMLIDNGAKVSIPRHVNTAAKPPYSLGTNDPAKIQLIRLVDPTVGVEEEPMKEENPRAFRLYAGYPNPFNSRTTLTYQLYHSADITLDIYDIRGARIARLVEDRQESGYYRVAWEARTSAGSPVSSGTYLAVLRAEGVYSTVRMQYVK